MTYTYIVKQYDPKKQARAVGVSLPISGKKSVEICSSIRGKSLAKAKAFLARVMDMAEQVRYTKFNRGGTGHKAGGSAGIYPIKSAKVILKLLNTVEANAESNGLDTKSLKIIHIASQKAPVAWHYGRQRRTKMKRSHVEIMVEEAA